jgi:hypothetical protein
LFLFLKHLQIFRAQRMRRARWNVLQGNGYAFSAETPFYFVVYSCVTASFARMSIAAYSPTLHISAYYLWVAGQDIEGNFRLRSVKICHEIEQMFSNAYTLIVRQYHKSGNPIISRFHSHMDNCYKSYGLVFVNGCITSCLRHQGAA